MTYSAGTGAGGSWDEQLADEAVEVVDEVYDDENVDSDIESPCLVRLARGSITS